MVWTRGLLAELPLTMDSPFSPPLREASRESSRSLPFCFSAPWHLTQDFSKMGLMSLSKVRPVLVAAGGSLLTSTSAAERETAAEIAVRRGRMTIAFIG